jgi:SAM-dependent methyltransferase
VNWLHTKRDRSVYLPGRRGTFWGRTPRFFRSPDFGERHTVEMIPHDPTGGMLIVKRSSGGARMFFDTVLRTQFGRPSGLVGSVFMRPLLNVANKRLMSASIELLDVRPKDVVLDVGFGGGYSLFLLAEKATRGRIAGIDYSPEMVGAADRGIAQKKLQSRVRVQCGDVMALPFQDVAFDKALGTPQLENHLHLILPDCLTPPCWGYSHI